MSKKVFVIWWGVDASNYFWFEKYLLSQEVNPYEEKKKKRKETLGELLWEGFEVLRIPMPNTWYAEYRFWKIVFEKYFPYFGDKNIFVGHSLGGSFLLKYFNENTLENILGIHLVAPATQDSQDEYLGSFKVWETLDWYKKYESKTTIYMSKDDPVVPFTPEYKFLKEKIGNAKFEIYDERWHFNEIEYFQELGKNIKK